MRSVFVAFSRLENKNKEIIIKDDRVVRKRSAYFLLVIFQLKTFYVVNLLSVASNMDIKDLLPPQVILGYELIAKIKLIF